MRAIRTAAIASAILAAVLCLAACGGGGSSSANSTTTPQPTKAPLARTPETPAQLAAERRAAGRAAPFVKADADNSVPTYGSEAAASERRAAEGTLKAFLLARQGEEWAKACRYLSASTRSGLAKLAKPSVGHGRPACAVVLPALSEGADLTDPLGHGLLSFRVEGANGFALFYGPGHRQYIVPMQREDGVWRPTQTGPIAYPPGAPPTTAH